MIYYVRHGETDFNLFHISQGNLNTSLNRTGLEQAEIVAEKLKECQFDVIFASPLNRALQTAEIINKYHNLKINYDERLIDASRGVFQGTLRMQTEFEDYFKNPKRFNGETKEETYKKIKSFVNDLNIYKGKNILIVGHSGILEYIKYCVKNQIITNETKLNINTDNCEIIKIEF